MRGANVSMASATLSVESAASTIIERGEYMERDSLISDGHLPVPTETTQSMGLPGHRLCASCKATMVGLLATIAPSWKRSDAPSENSSKK